MLALKRRATAPPWTSLPQTLPPRFTSLAPAAEYSLLSAALCVP